MKQNRFRNHLLLIALFIGLLSCTKPDNKIYIDRNYSDEINEARKEFAFYLERSSIPGGTIAIAKGGKLIYSEGFGWASRDLDVPTTRKTKFRIGTVSELFTSLAYEKMVNDGILNPDSSIQHYIPDFPDKGFKINLNQIVNHSTGFRDLKAGEDRLQEVNVTIQKGLDRFKNDDLIFNPGMFQSNTLFNYNLLGAIMEKATGKKYRDLLKEYVTDTLHLENTDVDNPFRTIKNRSEFFDYSLFAMSIRAPFVDLQYRAPSQGLLSNAEDLVSLGRAILYSDYVTDDMRENIFTPMTLTTGATAEVSDGWFINKDQNNRRIYARSGEVVGGGGVLLIYPDKDLIIAGAVNATLTSDEIPVFKIAQLFFKEDE